MDRRGRKRGGGYRITSPDYWRFRGWEHGYHLGRCEAVMKQIPQISYPKRDLKVLYVAEGSPGYYGLDNGIMEALSEMTCEPLLAGPYQDVAGLAKQIKPDLVLVMNGVLAFPAEQVDVIRGQGIKTAVWFADDPYFIDRTAGYAPHYDFVFTHELSCIPFYREHGCSQVHYLPFAASPRIYYPRPVDPSSRRDICFIGTAFPNRIRFFNRITSYLAHKDVLIAGGLWNRLNRYAAIKSKIQLAGIMPPATADSYSGARIVINLHRGFEERHNRNQVRALSVNPRTFEVSACGALQMTDVRQDLSDFYIPGQEIVTYSTPDDLMHKLEYYLNREQERREIALRGLYRTMREHTFHNRISKMLSILFG